jgi:hypothetical protein
MSDENNEILREGYSKSFDLLKECVTEHGFIASTEDAANYRRIWGRDGSIMSIAALLTNDEELILTARNTLETLIKNQGPHGEIPSNFDPKTGRISYGGTAGRVDADLWFLITCGQYLRKRIDKKFLDLAIDSIEKVRFLLGAWEFNNRGLLYVPMTGDWADEYIHHGYILFDQILYYRALIEVSAIHKFMHKSADHVLERKIATLKNLIKANFWLCGDDADEGYIYHEVLYKKGIKTAKDKQCRYWYSFFTPAGYGYRLDSLANVLVSLFGIANRKQSDLVDDYFESEVADTDVDLLPAFYPVITPEDDHWENLKMSFSYTFKNEPYEFHNGGLWPFVTGFYAADLALRGKTEQAEKYLAGAYKANKMKINDDEWSFPEFIHGKKHTAGGIDHLGWNAATAIMANHALEGKQVLLGEDYENIL